MKVSSAESAPAKTARGELPGSRVLAITEVLVSFILVHVAFRAIKQFTGLGRLDVASGLNFTPGVMMILFTVGVLLLCGRRFSAYGLTLERCADGLKLGMVWGLLLVGGAGVLMLFRIRYQAGGRPPGMRDGVAYGLASLIAVLVFSWLLGRRQKMLNRVPIWVCVMLIVTLLVLPLLLAWNRGGAFMHALLTVFSLVIGAGIGEEMFYRGYIQSRINEAFGRPFCLFGIRFGAGLLVSSFLFGLLHTLNTVDYFSGRFTFAWGYGLAALGTGLVFGCLRESSGSIVPGAVTHSILDVVARTQ